MTRQFLFISFLLFSLAANAQSAFKFAHVSDTHIGSTNADDDLRRTVANINNDSSLQLCNTLR